MCSQPPTCLLLSFLVSPWAPTCSPYPSLAYCSLFLSHTHPFPFSIVCSSPNIVRLPLSGSALLTCFFFFPHCSPSAAPSVCSCCDAAAGGAVELYSSLQQVSTVWYACSGYSAVDWIKNKLGGIQCFRREGLQQQSCSRDLLYSPACQVLRQMLRDSPYGEKL